MRKSARLDQILLSLGYADQDQITRALKRQESHGGRLGANLLELGVLTEDQLLTALADQYQLPAVRPTASDISGEWMSRLPAGVLDGDPVLPLQWNAEQRVLTLAVTYPDDQEKVKAVKAAFEARAVRLQLAPDSVLRRLAQKLRPQAHEDPDSRAVELPELFAMEDSESEEPMSEAREEPLVRKILMVAGSATYRNFLPPVFQKEGVGLTVVSEAEEAAEALSKDDPFEGVLVAQEMKESFSSWLTEGRCPRPRSEVTVFPAVSSALTANPISYDLTSRTLRSTVQALADSRCAQAGVSPPYGLMTTDLEALALAYGMRRLAVDGLIMALHLLLPVPASARTDPTGFPEPFGAFSSSLELATRLRFPWNLDRILDTCHGLFSARVKPGEDGNWREEAALGAQMLALVWYRHIHVPQDSASDEEAMIALRTALRDTAGRLASLEMIEAYLRLISERGSATALTGDRQVLLVGDERIEGALSRGLARMGCRVLSTSDLADAQTLAQRRPPGAIIIDRDVFPDEVDRFTRVVKLDTASLLFALTDATDPSLVLNLLDIGVDDVFGPPHEFDLMAARIHRAIRSRSGQGGGGSAGTGQFSATFQVFSFLDLVQTLSQGFKTVRINLSRGTGESAVIYMEKGRIIHAVRGSVSGPRAVYDVIAWEDDGEFTVHSETEFPEPTVAASTESLLMEGCRLLDESKREG